MKADLEPQSLSTRWSLRAASFSAVLFLASGAGHRYGVVETIPFFWLLGMIGMLAAGALVLAVWGFLRIWERGERGTAAGVWGILIALCVLAPFALSAVRMVIHPKLTDIATDPANPPQFALAPGIRGPGTNRITPITPEAGEIMEESYQEITGRRYDHSRDTVADSVRQLIANRNWQLIGETARAGGQSITIEAEAKTFFLGFPADVAIRIEGDENAAYVDVRSSSRYAEHDLGDNAKRIARFLADLDERTTAITGL